MINLVKNELKLFLGKKNIIISVILILIMISYYNSFTVNNYKNYYRNREQKISSMLKHTRFSVEDINNRIASLKDLIKSSKEIENPTKKDLENRDEWAREIDKLNIEIKRWKMLSSKLEILEVMYKDGPMYAGAINTTWKEIDDYIDKEIYEKKLKGSRNGFYLHDGRDWDNRKVLREANSEIPININSEYPSGLKAVSNVFSGEISSYIILFVLFILLANYDSWTNDFEENEGKIILTIPYKKSSIYFARFITRFLCTLGIILFSVLVVFVIASLKYGIGPNMKILINELTIKNPFIFNTFRPMIWEYDIPVTLSTYTLYSIFVFIFFILFIYSTINFISILLRDSMGIFVGGIILIIIIATTPYLKYSNIFSYYKVKDMIYMVPYYGYDWFWGIGLYTSILVIVSFIASNVGNFVFKRL